MILTDTGPLVGLLDRSDPWHGRCVQAMSRLPAAPLFTTWPCLTEAMYLLGRAGGWQAQEALWSLALSDRLRVWSGSEADRRRMAALMKTYADVPMDFADASLVAAAEATGLRMLFTPDGHFRIYRLADGEAIEVVP